MSAVALVRAYTKGAKIGIEAGIIIEKVKYTDVKIKIEYNQLGKIQNEIMSLGFTVKDTIYGEDVEIIVYSKVEDVESLKSRIIDITSATADISCMKIFFSNSLILLFILSISSLLL